VRDFLNGILTFIVATSLTDEEYDTVTAVTPIYDQTTYDDLSRILATREMVSTYQDRLLAYYQARGASITPAKTGKSNILLGGKLEY
jgi:hypothetical protein